MIGNSQLLSWRELAPPAAIAATLAFAGLPLYIHTPRFYAEEMGTSLTVLGVIILAARAIDSVQDPIIGRLADYFRRYRKVWAIIAGSMLSFGILLLFAPPEWGEPLPRLIIGLLAAFTGFSALQIVLYDHGLAQAEKISGGYTKIALWREVGGLIGICFAAATPAILGVMFGGTAGFVGYIIFLSFLIIIALSAMHRQWITSGQSYLTNGLIDALKVEGVGSILLFGFMNALPTAVTSTLFLFFVSDVIVAKAHAGPMLIVFFAAAAVAAAFWARIANRYGCKFTLIMGMSLSIPAFIWAWLLGPGDVFPFYVIVVASGATLGADMTLAPAMLASRIKGGGGQVFSIWTFLQKLALTVAAGLVLPLLAIAGYEPGSTDQGGLAMLSLAYALVPCGLKLIAIPVLWKFVDDIGEVE